MDRKSISSFAVLLNGGAISWGSKKQISVSLSTIKAEFITIVTNFIRSYLHQFFNDSHGLKASLKPLRRPFNRCQLRLKAINIGQDIKQINW